MNEAAWILGILLCDLGVCFCTKADFGLSMIAAPPYILHYALRDMFPWFTQGTSEYVVQGILLILLCIVVKKFKPRYLLSFVTAFLSGNVIDMWLFFLGGNGPYEQLWLRIVAFVIGESLIALAVAFFFRTTLPIQMAELIVCEISDTYKKDTNKVKLIYDIVFLVLSGVLSLTLTGGFNGFGIGTVIIVFVNAPLIAFFGKIIDKFFGFDSLFPFTKKYFKKS